MPRFFSESRVRSELENVLQPWLEQLARQPLRLYDLTHVVPGVGVTVCDALATDAAPLVVTERLGSKSLKAGMQMGARVMEVGGQHQFSGGIYPFTVGGWPRCACPASSSSRWPIQKTCGWRPSTRRRRGLG